MAEDLLKRITRELRERKETARAAYEESQRLQAALDALDATGGRGAATAAPPRRAASGARAPSTRAPRGENRRRILETIGERPGASAGEVASVTGIERPVVASTLSKLAKEGEVVRVERPAGGVGFRLPSVPSVFDAPAEAEGEATGTGGTPAPDAAVDADDTGGAEAPAEAASAATDAAPPEEDAPTS
jgi:hypothetical protein